MVYRSKLNNAKLNNEHLKGAKRASRQPNTLLYKQPVNKQLTLTGLIYAGINFAHFTASSNCNFRGDLISRISLKFPANLKKCCYFWANLRLFLTILSCIIFAGIKFQGFRGDFCREIESPRKLITLKYVQLSRKAGHHHFRTKCPIFHFYFLSLANETSFETSVIEYIFLFI